MKNLENIAFLVSASNRKLVDHHVRSAVLQAYDYTCQHCNGDSGLKATEADHIIPINPKPADYGIIAEFDLSHFDGSLDCLENLTASCKPCNIRKLNHLIDPQKIDSLLSEARFKAAAINFLAIPRTTLSSKELDEDTKTLESIASSRASALVWAAATGDTNKVHELTKQTVENVTTEKAAQASCIAGHVDSFQLLITKTNSENASLTAIDFVQSLDPSSLTLGHLKILTSAQKHFNENYVSPEFGILSIDPMTVALDCALKKQRPDLFEAIITENTDYLKISFGEDRRLVFAVASGCTKAAERALSDGADPTVGNHLAFKHALKRTNSSLAGKLLDAGADYSVNNYQILSIAIEDDNFQLFNRILDFTIPEAIVRDTFQQIVSSCKIRDKASFLEVLLNKGFQFSDQDSDLFSDVCTLALRYSGTFSKTSKVENADRYPHIIETCLKNGAKVHSQTALLEVIRESTAPDKGTYRTFKKCPIESEIVNSLTRAGACLAETGKRGLLWAAAQGEVTHFTTCASKLREKDINDIERAISRLAHQNDNFEILNSLQVLQSNRSSMKTSASCGLHTPSVI